MKETKKTNNILIRQSNKKGPKQEIQNKTKTSFTINQKKRSSKNELIEAQKQLTKAENLTQAEQIKIVKEASRAVGKKVKTTETKIENDIVGLLQLECNRLGQELQKEKYENQKQKLQITNLRKNMSFLNQKLQKIYKDNESLNKNNNYGQMEKDQLREQLHKLKTILKRKQDQYEHLQSIKNKQISELKAEIKERLEEIEKIKEENQIFLTKNQELQEELEDKKMEAQYIRENFEERKKQWDRYRMQVQLQNKNNLERKGEKITKFQGELQSLNDRLKDQEAIKKKLNDRNKEFEKQLLRKNECIRDLQDQLVSMKKRVNDLSILKSSNNTIMNQKITKIVEENENLRREIEKLKGKKITKVQQDKPVLFGASQFD